MIIIIIICITVKHIIIQNQAYFNYTKPSSFLAIFPYVIDYYSFDFLNFYDVNICNILFVYMYMMYLHVFIGPSKLYGTNTIEIV